MVTPEIRAILEELIPQLEESAPEVADKLSALLDGGDEGEPEVERDSEDDEFSFGAAEKKMTARRKPPVVTEDEDAEDAA